ncbi:MAG TPA: glutamine--fructose-6-phosphate transaminase (isomerizing) [Terriglobales bacterium]|nr:glutamine--fructose-6-phosphate transaminase (isomerizing) [Terriglobales bacterium]
MPDKSGFAHYMLKEIFEQPHAVRETVLSCVTESTGRVTLTGMRISPEDFAGLKKIGVAASGTSRHAGMAGRYMIQELAEVPVDVEHASEFEYGNPITGPEELIIVITQSGETADTLGALRKAKERGARTLAISNVLDSTISREADGVIPTLAGPEISIASTKAFTAQLAALYLFAVYLGAVRGVLRDERARALVADLMFIPDKIEAALASNSQCRALAEQYHKVDDFLFIGRGIHYPIALDGALKLKEVSYIHAEGYPAGEIKHGPYALIDQTLPLVGIATRDTRDPLSMSRWERNLASLAEVKKRGGRVIAIATAGDDRIRQAAHHVVDVPEAPELLSPILEIVPMQLLAYHVAVQRGLDVDRPRNLVKSVTAE